MLYRYVFTVPDGRYKNGCHDQNSVSVSTFPLKSHFQPIAISLDQYPDNTKRYIKITYLIGIFHLKLPTSLSVRGPEILLVVSFSNICTSSYCVKERENFVTKHLYGTWLRCGHLRGTLCRSQSPSKASHHVADGGKASRYENVRFDDIKTNLTYIGCESVD
jgi:hypothetical protein